MATYLQGQQDYVTQIQPTKPNLQFDAQMLGNLQNKYDAGHKKVSELYGSLLNSAMTRTDNIEARNEFFQMINQDIRRMGSLDFSLQQNVDAAANVFQSIYTNKGIVKDMVWTKNFQNQMSKRDGLKNSNDPDKTGGSVWDVGDRAMAYQKEAFRNASADEALGMRNVEYVPQQNMMKDAIKLAEKAKLNVTIDEISGKYKITTRNGELIKSPLTTLFASTFAKDPKYKDMYATKAYVAREDWQHNAVKKGEFKDLDGAKVGWLKDIQNKQTITLKKNYSDLQVDEGYLDKNVKKLTDEYNAGKFKADSNKGRRLKSLMQLQQSAKAAKGYTQDLLSAEKSTNPDAAYDVLASEIDNRRAYDYMNNDIAASVRVLAFRDKEITKTPDEFAKINVKYLNKLSEIKLKNTLDFDRDKYKQKQQNWRATLKANAKIAAGGNTAASAKVQNMAAVDKLQLDLNNDYSTSQVEYDAISELVKHKSYTGKGRPDITRINSSPNLKKIYEDQVKLIRAEEAKKMVDVNRTVVKGKGNYLGDVPNIPYPQAMTSGFLNEFGDSKTSSGETLEKVYIKWAMANTGKSELEVTDDMIKAMESGDANTYIYDLKL
tara:strand:+ start:3865 stop:5676 length:1812 start_codon:yes stop_codon:yes gene_type:complete